MGAGAALANSTEQQSNVSLSAAALARQAQAHRVDAVGTIQAVAELLREAGRYGMDTQAELGGLARDVSAIRKATAVSYADNLAERIIFVSDFATEPSELEEAHRLSRKAEQMGRKGLFADAADVRIGLQQEACDAELAEKRTQLGAIPDKAAAAFESGNREGLEALHLERQSLTDDLQTLRARAKALGAEMSALTPEGLLVDAVAKTDAFFTALKTERTSEASTQAQSLHCDIQHVTAGAVDRIAAQVQSSFTASLLGGDLEAAAGALEFLSRLRDLRPSIAITSEPTVISASVAGPREGNLSVDESRVEAIGQLRGFVEAARAAGMLSNEDLLSIARGLNFLTRTIAATHADNLAERIVILSQDDPTQEDLRAALKLSRMADDMARRGLFSEPADAVIDARIGALEADRADKASRLEGINARGEEFFQAGDREGLRALDKERARLSRELDKVRGRISTAQEERGAITAETLLEEALTRADTLFGCLNADRSLDSRNLAQGFHGDIAQLVSGHAQRCAEGVHRSFESNLQSGGLEEAGRDLSVLSRLQESGITITISPAPIPPLVQLESVAVSGGAKSELAPGEGNGTAALVPFVERTEPVLFQRPDEAGFEGASDGTFVPRPPVERVEPPVERVEPPVERVEPPVERVEPPVERVEPPVERAEPPADHREPPTQPPAAPPSPPAGTPAGHVVDFHSRKKTSIFRSIGRAFMPWTWRGKDDRASRDTKKLGSLARTHEERVSEYNRTRNGEQVFTEFAAGLDEMMQDIAGRVTRMKNLGLWDSQAQARLSGRITAYANNQLESAMRTHDRFVLLEQSIPRLAAEIEGTANATGAPVPAISAMNRRDWGANIQCEPGEDALSAVLRQIRGRVLEANGTFMGWASMPRGMPILGTV